MTPGQAAFEKWNSFYEPGVDFSWNKLPENAKAKWEEVAKAAIDVWHHRL